MSCYFVRHFHDLQFHVRHFQRPLSDIAVLSVKSARACEIDLDSLADKVDSRRHNRKLHGS